MESAILAAALGALIGLALSLTGAGGGVLAIPLLVFGLHLPVQQASPIGLLAVGMAAAAGAILGLRQRIVRYRAAALIGLTGMLMAPFGIFIAQRLPNRPLMALFAIVLTFVAWRMPRRSAQADRHPPAPPCHVDNTNERLTWTRPCARALAGTGLLSGMLSGLLGVGGGFVIIPALTRYTDLNVRSVQATSLAVIALVSLSGVSAATLNGAMPWRVALPFGGGALLALLVGRLVANKLSGVRLQQAFSWFCLATACLMLARAFGPAGN